MAKGNALGDYLRSRREQVRPEDVGLIPGARRRVAGLRREELALLAGISSDYYLRLEQGRDKNPSPQILDALARALQKITGDMGRIPTQDLREKESLNAFFIAPAFGGEQSLASLFSSHPPLEKRLEQLARISAQLGQ